MRAYFFCNQYLAGIHNGIQSGHALNLLWPKYINDKDQLATLLDFSVNHQTWICLNGGDHGMLQDLYFFMQDQKTYPFTVFQEPGLNNANTAVVIILPERMYDDHARMVGRAVLKSETDKLNPGNIPAQIRDDQFQEFMNRHYTPWELEFLKRKELCGKAS